ncbi:MAG: hypothetical protein QT08_C0013G0039 [archaeon GW2011_AR17]|nr:MAG: hypothetical protein QT08_C0013G0039 [archaeon GW2011_AR17]MBS3153881.1 hypothetical protein [Candidatus Woesearchaeota archaeon]HIH15482.1 hypothetical protein [Nanoarchaeota archaeon]HIH59285.1 hypothetical protein [Nanoarchaeota archaeon]HII13920.1 hypothetical protein [Nanoarchaeota archaeon]
MNKEVKKDILIVLKRVQPLLRKEDIAKLKILSNQTLHNAGLFQDTDSFSISVIIFSLSKIFNRPRLLENQAVARFKEDILKELLTTKKELERENEKEYQNAIKRIFQRISSFEKKFGMYITEVLSHAKIKKGGRMYEHGFSAGMASQLLGISSWELMSYLGETKLNITSKETTVSTKQRIQLTRKLFKT